LSFREVVKVTEGPQGRLRGRFDVAVIGGGAAGLSAAVTLGRARRSVVVVDAGTPRNAPAAGVHGFLTRDGMPPRELVAAGGEEVERYGGLIVPGQAVAARRAGAGGPGGDGDPSFEVTLADGRTIAARRLVVATGLVDELPDVPGLRELWGLDVVHCPYCHGWEIRDEPIGVLGTGPRSLHQALLFRQWTSDLVFFQHTAPPLTDEEAEELAAIGVRVVPGTVTGLETEGGRLRGVRTDGGTVVPRRALAVASAMVARAGVLGSLGLTTVPDQRGAGERIEADPTGLTTVPGVWVAGNVTDLMAQVVVSAAAGMSVGAAVNADLVTADARAAVAAYRESRQTVGSVA
jgi:thioredoxin reductase